MKYHKIQTVYDRDPETKNKHLFEGQFSKPEFEYLSMAEWIFTEKIDGTNIRVMIDSNGSIGFGGRTDNAQIPAPLIAVLQKIFTRDKCFEVFPPDLGGSSATITVYGEGFGNKIQKVGHKYIGDSVGFILFDVRIGDIWLRRWDVKEVAHKFDIFPVPMIGRGSLLDGIAISREGFRSQISEDTDLMAEGLVMRPTVELTDRLGKRIITKIKYKDFPR